MTPSATKVLEKKTRKFGTFAGVFLPSILTIFGVILYLRMGWIVGVGGLTQTIAIILLASSITLITALSLSSSATNMRIGNGGVYYVLSRTFGLKVGIAIGLPLFIAQALSISLYICGFAEAVRGALPAFPPKTIEITALSIIALLAFISTDLALKTQFLIFLLILGSLISFALGKPIETSVLLSKPTAFGFWPLFTLFFPAITGIETGISMSGDLKNPARSLPLGTLSAVLIGALAYCGIATLLSLRVPPEILISHPMIVKEIAFMPQLVIIGIWGATLSSSLSCLLSAPRTLGALAADGHLPRWIAHPKAAILITACFVLCGFYMGSIDTIAPVLSMFFLISYAMLNLATGIEGLIANPSWRPTFRTPWWLSLTGSALCLTVMLMINAGQTLIALMLVAATYTIGAKRKLAEGLEDMRQAILLFLSRFAIYRLSEIQPSARSWRPNFLVFLEDPFIRQNLVELTHSITHGQGFLIIASVLNPTQSPTGFTDKMKNYLDKSGVTALIETCSSEELSDGMKTFIKTAGIGPLTPNTIVLGATHKKEGFRLYADVIMLAHKQKRNVIIVREADKHICRRIDVWWGGLDKRNSELMLVFAYMLQTSAHWRGAKLTLKTVVSSPCDEEPMLEKLRAFSQMGRLQIETEVILAKENENVFTQTIQRASQGADLIFMGLRPPHENETPEEYGLYYEQLISKTASFPPMAFVLASEEIDFNRILT